MRFNLFRFKPARPQITQVNLRPFLWALPLAAIAMACDSPKGDTGALDGEFIDQQLRAAIEQYKVMEERVQADRLSSEERRVGTACVRTCRFRWSQNNKKKNK